MITANILNKYSWITEKGWSSLYLWDQKDIPVKPYFHLIQLLFCTDFIIYRNRKVLIDGLNVDLFNRAF
jgi:hypothetical protein